MTSYITESPRETADLAGKMAELAKPGDLYALTGDLGAGKSVFARGFIQALMPAATVPSPTFTLVQPYDTPRGPVYHFDLYRLEQAEEILELGWDDAMGEGICLIEWPERAGTLLPAKARFINFTTLSGESRKIEIDDPRS